MSAAEKNEAAQALIDAIKAEDPDAVSEAFGALSACESMTDDDDSEEKEPASKPPSALILALGKPKTGKA